MKRAFWRKKVAWVRRSLTGFWIACTVCMACLDLAMGQENLSQNLLQGPKLHQEGMVEVRLRAQAEVTEAVVRLRDLAECFPAEAALAHRVGATELFPAPAPGQRRYVTALEIEEILLRRGVPLRQVQMSGANQVEIRRRKLSSNPEAMAPAAPLFRGEAASRAAHRRQAESMAQQAILAYLQEKVPKETGWEVRLTGKEQLQQILNEQMHLVEVRGGKPPWTGSQWFELILKTPQGLRSVVVQAEVSVSTPVVVAARPIPKGTLLQPEDLALEPLAPDENPEGYFQQIQQLVGKEALRGLPAGRPIPEDAVQAPVLVRRGQIVTVYARAPGVRVRTQARAKQDGSLGDLVGVESLADRKTYFARVCGLQEVEVFARGIHTEALGGISSETASLPGHSTSGKTQ